MRISVVFFTILLFLVSGCVARARLDECLATKMMFWGDRVRLNTCLDEKAQLVKEMEVKDAKVEEDRKVERMRYFKNLFTSPRTEEQ